MKDKILSETDNGDGTVTIVRMTASGTAVAGRYPKKKKSSKKEEE